MTQALNYTVHALEAFADHPLQQAPGCAVGVEYLAGKLRQAQPFVLADHGMLLDRSKPRPELPASLFRPPFPVVALEYEARSRDWGTGFYDAAQCSRRIALAWDWQNDLPFPLTMYCPPALGPGVAIASVAWYDEQRAWLPVSGGLHVSYDAMWTKPTAASLACPHRQAMIETGRISAKLAGATTITPNIFILLPEIAEQIGIKQGGFSGLVDVLAADCMDELNAYMDLCIALACRNVTADRHAAPARLNKHRAAKGKLPLKDFHVLNLSGGGDMPGASSGGDRNAPRSHLRRGHVRRLSPDRMTWVNQTIVRGRAPGFVDKVYAL